MSKKNEEEGGSVADILKEVRRIEVKAKRLSDQIFSGEYHSAFKGRGMSFSEVREYQYGDDIRAIDWNVTARFNTPFVKIFEEERELTVMMMVDVSQSMYFGTREKFKNELVTEICALIAISAIKNNDKVGVILFSDTIEKFIPPKKGKSHVLRIIDELRTYEPTRTGTNIEQVLKYFSNVAKKRTIAFLMSDFDDEGYQRALDLVARKHDLVGVYLHDPAEENLGNVGVINVKDAESGETQWLDTSNKTVRNRQGQYFRQHKTRCKEAFVKAGADLIDITTEQKRRPYVREMMNFFKKRGG